MHRFRLASNSLLKNAQTEMSVPPEAPDSLRKVDRTFLSGPLFVVFQQAANVGPLREVFSLLCLCCAAVGCGSGENRIKTTPVSGTVTFEGKPVPEGSLLFVPLVAGPSGQANLRENGTFVAGTYEKADGLIPGEYDVMIQGNIIPTDPHAVPLMPHEVAQRPPAKKHALPDRYGDQKKSGLKTTIQMGQQTPLKFDLQK